MAESEIIELHKKVKSCIILREKSEMQWQSLLDDVEELEVLISGGIFVIFIKFLQ